MATEMLSPCDQYTLETEAFSRAVRGQIPLPFGLEDALMNMRIIDAISAPGRAAASKRYDRVQGAHASH
jgi:predicted dehydrogenase